MRKTASFWSGVENAVRRVGPAILAGAGGGMLLARAVGPEEDRNKYLLHGALIGGTLGYAKMRRRPHEKWNMVLR